MNNPPRVVEVALVVELLEGTMELLETVSSEIPIQSPKRQVVEEGMRKMRGTIAVLRQSLQASTSTDAQTSENET